ncbi:hypothetical protein KY317_04360 [Candidatus Woesearchaeota archaeon]|nr:hypothetical protein [Candidatus Woesearchaeota archaeon]
MGASKGSYLTVLLIVFVLFLSLISIIFRQGGMFLRVEIVVCAILGLLAIIFLSALSAGRKWAWSGLFIFFVFHFINLFAIYSRTLGFKQIAIPMLVSLIGLYMSAVKIEHGDEDDFDYNEPVFEEDAENEEILTNVPEENTKKKAKKKTSKKK